MLLGKGVELRPNKSRRDIFSRISDSNETNSISRRTCNI